MHNGASQQPLVLEYDKRRFDGGSERDMIEQIESQYRMPDHTRLSMGLQQPGLPPMVFPNAPKAAHPEKSERKLRRPDRHKAADVFHALTYPYVKLVLGMSGVVVGTLLFASLTRKVEMDLTELRQERDALVMQSWQTISKSIVDIARSPMKALRIALR